VSGYVLDHHAVIAGLAGTGSEHHRREVSRILTSAIDGGPAVAIPALCLAVTAGVRLAVIGHVADLIASTGFGVITVPGLERPPTLDAVREVYPQLDWPAAHAVSVAITTATPLITTDPSGYTGVPVDVLDL
jgi:hypothetical protein